MIEKNTYKTNFCPSRNSMQTDVCNWRSIEYMYFYISKEQSHRHLNYLAYYLS